MTLVNVALIALMFAALPCGGYLALAAVGFVAGRVGDRDGLARGGVLLALGSAATFGAYLLGFVAYMVLYPVAEGLAGPLGIAMLFSKPLAYVAPPLVAWLLAVRDDGRAVEPAPGA